MKVLVACEYSAIVRDAFRRRGHYAWSCDLIESERSGVHFIAAPVSKICLENPVSIISTHIRKPDQVIQPWQFGHGETKATCLWLKNLPKLVPTNIVDGRVNRVHRLPPFEDRWKDRSRTYEGVARAMAEQWG